MLNGNRLAVFVAALGVSAGVAAPATFASSSEHQQPGDRQARSAPPTERSRLTTSVAASTVTGQSTASPFASPNTVPNDCSDTTIASGSAYSSPGPGPNLRNVVIGSFGAGRGLNLDCQFFNNVGQRKYYAEIGPGAFGNNQYAYVWVARLYYGSRHECYHASSDLEPIGSSLCPLTNVN